MRVSWHHNYDDEPVTIYSEIEGEKETRKVEIYRDGHMDLAGPGLETGSTFLSVTPMPSVEEIAAQPEFSPTIVDEDEFERVWWAARREHGIDKAGEEPT
ncbi:DUF6881 domain-containing protein [Jiangella rhizosphaerae]|uniref:DUF6881 domain-containing protein n=1 Tax=Jiangella rhizosphaerae TaxID=2293569 RepID=UPI0011C34853|nr:hypothetical protein [Jiangella rhizosphaerae]